MVDRVLVTNAALELVEKLRSLHGPLMFHQSGGCCDGSAPMCYPAGEFTVGSNDVHLGEIGGCPVYMDADQFEYWKHTQLTIDVVEGRGSGFSLEAPEGVRFLTRSRVFTDEEADALARAEDAALQSNMPLKGRRVVIADDDRIIREFLSLRCAQLGLTVETAEDGAGAVDTIAGEDTDLLIVDLNLPDMNGFDIVERLAKSEPRPPVIVMTGSTAEDLKRRCRDLNEPFVHKNADTWNVLEPLIREIVGAPSASNA